MYTHHIVTYANFFNNWYVYVVITLTTFWPLNWIRQGSTLPLIIATQKLDQSKSLYITVSLVGIILHRVKTLHIPAHRTNPITKNCQNLVLETLEKGTKWNITGPRGLCAINNINYKVFKPYINSGWETSYSIW